MEGDAKRKGMGGGGYSDVRGGGFGVTQTTTPQQKGIKKRIEKKNQATLPSLKRIEGLPESSSKKAKKSGQNGRRK